MDNWISFDRAEVKGEAPLSFFPCMVVVQARMGSTRLPGKVLKPVMGKPLLSYLIERLRKIQHVQGIVIATTTNPKDDPIVELCNHESVHVFRGSEDDVLSRYYGAAKAFDLEVVVRITSDCPVIDPKLVDEGLFCFRSNYDELDYLSNSLERTFPRGMDFEIMRFEALEKAFFHARLEEEREHVTPYLYKHPKMFRLGNLFEKKNNSKYRLTVDTQEDFLLIQKVFENLYPENPNFTLDDILTLMKEQPELHKINAHIMQKTLKV